MITNKIVYKDYKMRYSLTTPDIGISFKNMSDLKKFLKENYVYRGNVIDHKYRKICGFVRNSSIIKNA